MAGNQYRDYIKRSFLKYACSIISLLFVLMGLFLFINVQWISVGSNRKNNALLASALDSQVSSYKEGLEHFSTDYRDRKSTRLNSSHCLLSRMPSSA